ncbi:Methyltransferase-like protein 21D [Papilio machaon]|uniref:Methyltransferase-like protein 21D n=1 Tax=Papilio machaon TaxID=76193 RepID=A0A0N0PFK4_PAPMA|nr:Methyltransferase-like protein 21D [Papilio machaon]
MSHRRGSLSSNDLFPREIDIEICLKTLKIYQKLEGDVNCVVWDASLVLAKYLETICQEKPDFLSGTRVLELGSGLGVVGLTAATLGAQVTLTDLPEALPLLRLNISENKQKIGSMGGYAIAEVLEWGDNNSDIHKQEFDMVVLADCVYYEDVIYVNILNFYMLLKGLLLHDALSKFCFIIMSFNCIVYYLFHLYDA